MVNKIKQTDMPMARTGLSYNLYRVVHKALTVSCTFYLPVTSHAGIIANQVTFPL